MTTNGDYGTPDAANLGVFRPPLIYLTAIAVGFALEGAWPLPFLPAGLAPAGVLLVVFAALVFGLSVRSFRAAGTPLPAHQPTTQLVRTGPHGRSRNPIYVAFSLGQLGIAVAANSLWLIVTLIPAVALMSWVVIPREEQYLERKFGTAYTDYKSSVRRWL